MASFNVNKLVSMSITGVNSTMVNIAGISPQMRKKIKPEINDIGRNMLADLRAVTPVITGKLKRSAYYSAGETNPTMIDGSIGYTAPYSPDVEFRHNMLGDTLNEWNEQIRQRIIGAGFQALEERS